MIDDELTMPMKRMGMVTLFNGVDVLQSKHFIKLSCQTYIKKMSAKHLIEWMHDFKDMSIRPLPMPATESFMKKFNAAEGDPDERVQQSLQNEHKFA